MNALFSNIRSSVALIVAGVMILIAVGLLLHVIRAWFSAIASRSWSIAQGQVLSSTLHRTRRRGTSGGGSYVPLIVYQYMVDGQVYSSSRYSFGAQVGIGIAGIAQRALNDYPVGKTIDVYYNPTNPSEAVLKRSAGSSWTYLLVVIALGVATTIVLSSFAGVSLPF